MVYLLTILICSIIIYIPNAIANPAGIDNPWVYYLLAVIIYIAASVVVDGIVAFVIRRLPKKWMDPKKGMIVTRDWELKLYNKLHVQSWKRFMPDLGKFTNFQKGKITDPLNNEYIGRYILEASYGVVIHYLSVPFSALVLLLGLIDTGNLATWTVGVPVMVVNMVLILLPALALKYNLPKLVRVYDINVRMMAKRAQKENSESI